MPGNRYMSSFQSKDHPGKLGWAADDLKFGKIPIVRAMELAEQWCGKSEPFGQTNWEIENVTFRFRSGMNTDKIEYITSVTLKTPEYKTIEVIVLSNNEIVPPDLNPEF